MSKRPRKSGLIAKLGTPFAKVTWCAEDLADWRPGWSVAECCEWLEVEEDGIQQAMIEAGHRYISEYLGHIHVERGE